MSLSKPTASHNGETADITLKVAAVPFDTLWADVSKNIDSASATLDRIEPGTDIVVFPELFTTGFIVDPQLLDEIAEPCDGRTMRWAAAMARKPRRRMHLPLETFIMALTPAPQCGRLRCG